MRPDEIEHSVSLQRRSYALLRWAAENPNPQQFHEVHGAGENLLAARAWLERQQGMVPPECRPEEHELEAFASFFSTYLVTSFDLVEDPGVRGISLDGSVCRCSICMQLAQAPRLQPKRLGRGDKKRARDLMASRLRQLGLDLDRPLPPGREVELLVDSDLEEDAALSTYGVQLLERCAGRGDGPAVLALWRRFAWDRSGAPKRDFELAAGRILEAEARLVERLRTTPS